MLVTKAGRNKVFLWVVVVEVIAFSLTNSFIPLDSNTNTVDQIGMTTSPFYLITSLKGTVSLTISVQDAKPLAFLMMEGVSCTIQMEALELEVTIL